LPKINLSRIGSAAVAAATGVIMSVAPVFAQSTPTSPTPGSGSVITIIIDSITYKFELSNKAAAKLAAELATQVQETGTANDVEEELDVDEDADHQAPATTVAVTKTVHTQTQHSAAGAEHEGS
jgi:hypothetical protein